MIDPLISSDFAVLAREHRQIPPLDAVMPRPREKVVRPPWKLDRWIVRAIVCGSAVLAVRSQWFDQHPQSAPLIVLAIVSLLGLFDTGAVRDSFARQLGAILGAIVLSATATIMFVVDCSTYSTLYIGRWGTQFRIGPDEPLGPTAAVGISILAIVGGYAIARLVAPRIEHRTLQPWSSLATIWSTSVFVTWIGVLGFGGHSGDAVAFQLYPRPRWEQLMREIGIALHEVFFRPADDRLTSTQLDFLLAGAGIALLLGSIAVALRRNAPVAAKWLAIVEHVVVAPVAVAFGMVNLVLYLTVYMHQGPDDGAIFGALSMVGVLIAFTSMMLRRHRRATQ